MLAAELDEAGARFSELESTETIADRQHDEFLEKVNESHAKEFGVWKETLVVEAD